MDVTPNQSNNNKMEEDTPNQPNNNNYKMDTRPTDANSNHKTNNCKDKEVRGLEVSGLDRSVYNLKVV